MVRMGRARTGLLACVAIALAEGRDATAQCLNWSTEFSTNANIYTQALLGFDDGSGPALYAGGQSGVLRWNGSSWTNLLGLGGPIQEIGALAAFNDGSGMALYAGGNFTEVNGMPSRGIAQWSGTTWLAVGGGLLPSGGGSGAVWIDAMAVFDDGSGPALYLGGQFSFASNGSGPVFGNGIIKWDGSMWTSLAGGITASTGPFGPSVRSLAVFDDGTGPALFAGGNFTAIGGVPANHIAKWNGASWTALGSGVGPDWVAALATYDEGTGPALYAVGPFTLAGGIPCPGLARWTGSTWSLVGGGVMGGSRTLAVFDDGSGPALYLDSHGTLDGTYYQDIARWYGTHWTMLGEGVNSTDVFAMTVFDNGASGGPGLYVGGGFSEAGHHIPSRDVAKWNGCQVPIASMCPGDGTLTGCPCNNLGASGHGCANSANASGALLTASGTTVPDTLVLSSTGEPSTALTIFLMGDTLTSAPFKFGDGRRCVGGQLLRLFVGSAVAGNVSAPQPGDPSISQRSANLGHPFQPGAIRYFQAYYRDAAQGFCPLPNGNNFNISSGLRVIW